MRIAHLTQYIVRLPLRGEFKHASATRRSSENIVIRCRLADGTEGWGEGVPRSYVTGESAQTASAMLVATPLTEQLGGDCRDWHEVFQLCDTFQPVLDREDPRGRYGNALRCAVELSILDAFGRLFGDPLSRITHCFAPAGAIRTEKSTVRYSTAISAGTPFRAQWSAFKMRVYGFAQCKVKVGVAGAHDEDRLRSIRHGTGPQMDLRLDANEAWPAAQVMSRLEPLLAYNMSAVEQPVAHREVEALSTVRQKLDIPIMLDESLTSMVDAREAIRMGTCDLFNIRLSKCGGFLNSLRLAAMAHEAGLGYQLGCHPGESGLLSAAGRHWAVSVDHIRYLEGSYDRHLLKKQLTREDITFRYGGRARALDRPGLGVTVDPVVLRELAVYEKDFPVG